MAFADHILWGATGETYFLKNTAILGKKILNWALGQTQWNDQGMYKPGMRGSGP